MDLGILGERRLSPHLDFCQLDFYQVEKITDKLICTMESCIRKHFRQIINRYKISIKTDLLITTFKFITGPCLLEFGVHIVKSLPEGAITSE